MRTLRTITLCIVALVALAVGTTATARADFASLASPGPLGKAHAPFERACEKCHVPFKGIPDAACLQCHDPIKQHIDQGQGPHAVFVKQGQKCTACHHDHKGRDHALSPSVAKIGFDHAREAGVVLEGKHAGVACASCHKPGPSGQPRWVGLPALRLCVGCHADPHRGALGSSCASCHSATAWRPVTHTIAQHKLPMNGNHAGLTCALCHAQGKHLVAEASCGDCHEQKHGGTSAPCARCHSPTGWKPASFTHDFCTCILPGKHQSAPCLSCHPAFRFKPTPFACAECHQKDLKHEPLGACSQCHSALSWKARAFDHNKPRVGFKLEGKHLQAACENCHTRKGIFSGAPKACEGCHKVPEHGDFGACARCHGTIGFDKPSFDHAKTRFPLDGKHAAVACQTCHARFKPGELQPGPNACRLCHRDPHEGQFGMRETGFKISQNGPIKHVVSARFGCLDCHTTKAWKPSTIDAESHADLGFVLRGRHRQVKCSECHQSGVFAGTPRECSACHLDRHRGRFGDRCARCHDESGWEHHPGFDHAVATGFPLVLAHAKASCADCHGADRQRLQRVEKVTCATCHTPRHGDQFGKECVRCHQPTRFSDVPPFDHSRTHFPLDRRHQAVRCTTCHDAARGPRLVADCRFCHGDPHRGRTLLDCGECHRADVWSLVRFDHDRTEFPLRGRHFTTACRDCHTNDQYTGIRSECVSCHRGDRRRADTMHIDHRGFSFDCGDCHRPFNW